MYSITASIALSLDNIFINSFLPFFMYMVFEHKRNFVKFAQASKID